MAGKRVTTAATSAVAANVSITGVYGRVMVSNSGTVPVYARTDGTAAVVGGDDCDVVLAGTEKILGVTAAEIYDPGNPTTTAPTSTAVSVISASASTVTITGING